jgi:hypothetical protein
VGHLNTVQLWDDVATLIEEGHRDSKSADMSGMTWTIMDLLTTDHSFGREVCHAIKGLVMRVIPSTNRIKRVTRLSVLFSPNTRGH